MAFYTGFVDDSGSEGAAHRQMLLKIKELAEANGWATLRYLNPSGATDTRELILKGIGLSGDQEIYIGFRSYQDPTSDYYNLSVAGFIGYVSGNTFVTQPGFRESGVPAYKTRIDYWLAVNAQRIAFGLKVGTPVYESGYAGYFLPYATPGQWPYPLVVAGMLNGASATRYSETSHSMPYKGNRVNFALRNTDGTWLTPYAHPWWDPVFGGATAALRETGTVYPLMPITLSSADLVDKYGDLDGISFVPGFGNAVENTITDENSVVHTVIQDVGRTGFNDYYALRNA